MPTAFSPDRFSFTKRAHLAAQKQFYVHMFPHGVEFEDTTKTAHDLDYAIDCKLSAQIGDGSFRGPVSFGVQERFRDPKYMDPRFGDVTITEWNLLTDEPSELHKLAAQMFVYGFYDEIADKILYAASIDVGFMQYALINGDIDYTRQKRGDQSFIGLSIAALRTIGAVTYERDNR